MDERFKWVFIGNGIIELQDNGIVKFFNNGRLEVLLNELQEENEDLKNKNFEQLKNIERLQKENERLKKDLRKQILLNESLRLYEK